MTILDVKNKIHYYVTGETLPGSPDFIEQMSSDERTRFENDITWLYDFSFIAQDLMEDVAALGTINVARSKIS